MNLPNSLTLGRLALTAVFVTALSVPFPWNRSLALALFLVAVLTDYLDGVIARKGNLITDFGKLMDPLADKILTASAFVCLVPLAAIPAWLVIVIISREFLITGLRLLAGSQGVVLPAERLGKHKTAWQMITIVYFLIRLAASDFSTIGAGPIWELIGNGLLAITTILTLYSGLAYLWKNRSLIRDR